MNTDLLQARIREQAAQITETQREIAKTRSELKQSRLETERLKSELSQSGSSTVSSSQPQVPIHKLRINTLASGGLNKDEFPGDDTVVVQFVPVDRDNEPVKVPGELEVTIIDPLLAGPERELGRWSFTLEQCRNQWTRGIASSGFQFNLPLERLPQHADLVVQLRFMTSDAQRCSATQIVKVVVPPSHSTVQNPRLPRKLVQVVDEFDQSLPPVGDQMPDRVDQDALDKDLAEWDHEDRDAVPTKPGNTVLHSTNWTDATIPRLR